MSEKRWFSDTILYDPERGYVMLQLPAIQLSSFTYEVIAYEPKAEFHISLLCTQELAKLFSDSEKADDKIREAVEVLVKKMSIRLTGFTSQAYACEKEGAKSIIVRAKVEGIEELFQSLRTQFVELAELPSPLPHVTLYKYNHRYGIGIQNSQQLRELCRPIPFEIIPEEIKEML